MSDSVKSDKQSTPKKKRKIRGELTREEISESVPRKKKNSRRVAK